VKLTISPGELGCVPLNPFARGEAEQAGNIQSEAFDPLGIPSRFAGQPAQRHVIDSQKESKPLDPQPDGVSQVEMDFVDDFLRIAVRNCRCCCQKCYTLPVLRLTIHGRMTIYG